MLVYDYGIIACVSIDATKLASFLGGGGCYRGGASFCAGCRGHHLPRMAYHTLAPYLKRNSHILV